MKISEQTKIDWITKLHLVKNVTSQNDQKWLKKPSDLKWFKMAKSESMLYKNIKEWPSQKLLKEKWYKIAFGHPKWPYDN